MADYCHAGVPLVVVGPKVLPQQMTDEVTKTFWLREIQIVNDSQAAITVAVYDRSEPPICVFSSHSQLGAGGMLSGNFPLMGRLMIGGMSWCASAPTAHGFAVGDMQNL